MNRENTGRSLLDRALRSVRPTCVSTYVPPPQQLDEGLWVVERKLRMPGAMRIPAQMTVLRLPTDGLLLHSPVKLDASLTEWLNDVGPVEALVAPNSFHYMFAADYLTAFPTAALFVAPDLPDRIASLPPATLLGDAAPPLWAPVIEQIVFGPMDKFTEVVFFHKSTGTLILTDLAFNITDYDSSLNRIAWRLAGVSARFGPSRSARMTLLRDKIRAGAYLRRLLDWPFRRILVAHGAAVEQAAQAEFRRAFAAYVS